MSSNTSFIFKLLNILFWIIFIGLCINTGSLLYSYFVSVAINPGAANALSIGYNLEQLYQHSTTSYSIIVFSMIFISALKAYIGYCTVRIFSEIKLDKPFSGKIYDIITDISRVALWTGLLSITAQAYTKWLLHRDVDVPVHWSSGEILFFAGVIYIIAYVYRKGTELQSDNELTV